MLKRQPGFCLITSACSWHRYTQYPVLPQAQTAYLVSCQTEPPCPLPHIFQDTNYHFKEEKMCRTLEFLRSPWNTDSLLYSIKQNNILFHPNLKAVFAPVETALQIWSAYLSIIQKKKSDNTKQLIARIFIRMQIIQPEEFFKTN